MLTEEQNLLRDSVRKWTRDNAPVSALRTLRDSGSETGVDTGLFGSVAEMGLTGVVIPAAYGGSEFGYRSMGLALEELGRNLVPLPLIGSAVGFVTALVAGGTEGQKKEWLPRIADGSAVGALAVDESGVHRPETIGFKATKEDDRFVLSGTKAFVLEGLSADVLVVAARTRGNADDADGVTLFCVPADAKGISRKRREVFDSRGYADLIFDDVKVAETAVVGTLNEGRELLDAALDSARAAIAAEAYGLSLQAFEITLEYMKTRVQFGQTIGSFQALQHRAAEIYMEIQLARSVVDSALDGLDEAAPDSAERISAAKARVNDLVNLVSREMVQLHGGIAMTDVHDAGLYLKRARALEATFGSAAYHRERYARLVGV
jgi:alkylation response protein AidB-like acyl-CoA dehydrogenase